MNFASASNPTRTQLRQELTTTLSSLYMGDCKFLSVFDETPVQAIAAFKSSPEAFGVVRTYLGTLFIARKKAVVIRLAKKLAAKT